MKRDYFSIIVKEICEKQNGIKLKRGDDQVLRELFLKNGGDVDKLHNGVLPEFDKLKSAIVSAYSGNKIAASKIKISVDSINQVIQNGKIEALKISEGVLGKPLLKALLK